MKVLALDYGAARTGVAVSDATGLLARPLTVVERAASPTGVTRLRDLVEEHEVELVVVGLPLTLRGEHGHQAGETEAFVSSLRAAEMPRNIDRPAQTASSVSRIARVASPASTDSTMRRACDRRLRAVGRRTRDASRRSVEGAVEPALNARAPWSGGGGGVAIAAP